MAATSSYTDKKGSKILLTDHLHHLAFDNSLLANIISVVSTGEIIAANSSACKLLGYSRKVLLTRNMKDIFDVLGADFKKMVKCRQKEGHVVYDIHVIKNGGKVVPCQITSVVFIGDHHFEKAITTIVNKSESIRKQKSIDQTKDKQVAAEFNLVRSKSKASLNRVGDLERILEKEIMANEKLQSTSRFKQKVFDKEMEEEMKLKNIQIAEAITEAKELERSDLGKELHDNVNQLLVASKLYLEIARKNKEHQELYLRRSSEYIITAIEEIRKLTKGMITDVVKNLGLCDAIENIVQDTMEVYPVKISCVMDKDIHSKVTAKFSLNIFRIVQEQLNNIIKHAKASVIEIAFTQNDEAIVLTISDNGSGFDITKKGRGIGIANIKSRAEFYKGTANFDSQPGKGCVLTVSFPRHKPLINTQLSLKL